MNAASSRWPAWSLGLHLITIGLLVAVLLDPGGDGTGDEADDGAGSPDDELSEELSMARYDLQQQANRLRTMLDKLAREGIRIEGSGLNVDTETEPESPEALLDEMVRITGLLSRWKHDPLQREPVEKERARLEDLLRRHGDETIEAIALFFPTIPELLPPEAHPTWMQTRLLTHVVGQIKTEAAIELCRSIFDDPGINSGVRLAAAEIALEKYPDRITEKLIDLLENPDTSFSRPNQIVLYFKKNKDPRVIPAFLKIAGDVTSDRGLRRFTLETMGHYPEHRVIDALKTATLEVGHGDLRGVALNSLNEILGKDILDFIRHLKTKVADEDPLLRLIENIEEMWEEKN